MKKSPLKTVSHDQIPQESLSKANQNQNTKSLPKKSPQTFKFPKSSPKTPTKSPSQRKEQSKIQTSNPINKNNLFLIPEIKDTSQENIKLNGFKQNVSFVKQEKISEKKKQDDYEFDQRYPNFQRSSIKLSEKQYHVSLAGSLKSQNPVQLGNNQSKKPLNKQVTSLSPTKNKNEFQTEQQIEEWLAKNLIKTSNESIKNINEQFKQLIEEPLKIQEQLWKSGNGIQRCLTHNTPFSLYCGIDRQLLCVSCIYSQKAHKNHQIIPLMKSQKQMKEDMEGFRNRIQATLAQSESLVRQASLNLIKVEKEYPILVKSIDSYYTNIHALIDEKKTEQIEYVQSLKQEYKNQLKTINSLLNKISNIFQLKLKQIQRQSRTVSKEVYQAKSHNKSQDMHLNNSQTNSYEILLNSIVKHRCQYEILSRFHKILTRNSDLLFEQKKTFNINLQNFQNVVNLIKYKLAIVVPVIKKEESRKPWIVELLGEEGAKQVGMGNQKYNIDIGNKDQSIRSQQNSLKNHENKPLIHRKGFSTSPQVPKGISRRFL